MKGLLTEISIRKEGGKDVWYFNYQEEATIWQRLHSIIQVIIKALNTILGR